MEEALALVDHAYGLASKGTDAEHVRNISNALRRAEMRGMKRAFEIARDVEDEDEARPSASTVRRRIDEAMAKKESK
jgi:ribosomal protein S20